MEIDNGSHGIITNVNIGVSEDDDVSVGFACRVVAGPASTEPFECGYSTDPEPVIRRRELKCWFAPVVCDDDAVDWSAIGPIVLEAL